MSYEEARERDQLNLDNQDSILLAYLEMDEVGIRRWYAKYGGLLMEGMEPRLRAIGVEVKQYQLFCKAELEQVVDEDW